MPKLEIIPFADHPKAKLASSFAGEPPASTYPFSFFEMQKFWAKELFDAFSI